MNYLYFKNSTLAKVEATSFSDDIDSIKFDLKSVYDYPPAYTLHSLDLITPIFVQGYLDKKLEQLLFPLVPKTEREILEHKRLSHHLPI